MVVVLVSSPFCVVDDFGRRVGWFVYKQNASDPCSGATHDLVSTSHHHNAVSLLSSALAHQCRFNCEL